MTVETTNRSAVLNTNGSAVTFPFSFKTLKASDIQVSLRNKETKEIETVYTEGEYTLAGVGNSFGSVTFPVAPVAGKEILITRTVLYRQETDIVNQGGFFPQVVEDSIDSIVMMTQQLSDETSRSLKTPDGETAPGLGTHLNANPGSLLEYDGEKYLPKDFADTAVGSAVAAAEAAAARAELIEEELFAALNAIEVSSFGAGILATSVGQSFIIYDPDSGQLRRYKNGTSVDVNDPVFVVQGVPLVTVVETLEPSGTWNGTAGTGFASAPTDPTRTTAKPFLRMLTVPHQAFTDTQLVGVLAGANYLGSLTDNMGLQKVRFHYEGGTLDVAAPSLQSFQDANGNTVRYFGWWATLAHNDVNGLANLYVEAFPKDGTMQNRVIGPFRFAPSATLFDKEVTVAPSLSEVAGVRYQTLAAAIGYHRGNASKRPRITITQAGVYDPEPQGANYTALETRLVIDATAPATIRRATYDFTTGRIDTRVTGLEFRGSNITFDFLNSALLERSIGLGGAGTVNHWFNGCNITNSGGRDYLVRGLNHDLSPIMVRGAEWCLTECTVTNMYRVGANALIARGNACSNLYNDQFNAAGVAIGNTVDGINSTFYTAELACIRAQYTGAGATATLEMSGAHLANNRVITAKVNGSKRRHI